VNAPLLPQPAPARDSRRTLSLCAAVIVGATLAVYARGLGGLFLYDDVGSIPGNPSIRSLSGALSPPGGLTVTGRPVLNFSFALNYAVSGTRPWSYHALNVAIHAAAALALFAVVRRTLANAPAGCRPEPERTGLAFAAALLWALHPLQTESVEYVVQRAESLMGLFYLLTLYAFVRSAASAGPAAAAWAGASVGACLLGMGTKEAMATAPLAVLLYDRTFIGGSFREAWRRRGSLHLSLAACWLPLAFLVAGSGGRGGTAGFGSGMDWWSYLMAQPRAVALYLRLALWPHPLVGDYGRILGRDPAADAAGAAVVLCLAAATFVLLRRRPAAGFLGAWFFLALAPSSSVIPVSTEIIAEHRVYLALAAVVTAAVLCLRAALSGPRLFAAAVAALALACGALTIRRVGAYGSPFAFWSDVVLKNPANAGAWNNLGNLLEARGDQAGAMASYRRALGLVPAYADAHYNLGRALAAAGRLDEAVANYEDALRFRPQDPSIHFSLSNALAAEGRAPAAAAELRAALRLDPARADAWYNLGAALAGAGDLAAAADAYASAVRLRPDFADARVNYGAVLAQLGRTAEAVRELNEALRLEPAAADVHNNLGSLLAGSGRLSEARAQFEEALRLKPDYGDARENLERLRALEQPEGGR
jgi:tetratricopeptide (TPR) repeat protein